MSIMQEEITNPVESIRSVKRVDLRDVRNKHKEVLLGNKRLGLNEVSNYVQDVTLPEFNELLLKLKQKQVPLELLRKIKKSCVTLEIIETVFRNDGAFRSLIRLLICNDGQKQLEAAACLTNLTCGLHKYSLKVAKASGAYLITFINGRSDFLQDQCIWALGNIANDCLECFNVIKSQGVLSALHKVLESSSSYMQSVVFALNACTKYDDPEVIPFIQTDLTKHLLCLLEKHNTDSAMFLDAASTISNCCFFSIKYSLNIFDIKYVERIVNILMKLFQDPEVDDLIALPLVRCIAFLSYSDEISEFLASQIDFFKVIEFIASIKSCTHLIKEALWALCNVTVSSNTFSNNAYLMPFINIFSNILKLEKSITLQVLYFLSILVSKNEHNVLKLIQHEIFDQIECLLQSEEQDIIEAARVFLKLYSDGISVKGKYL